MSRQAKYELIWDIPTRVFHWLLVLSFSIAYFTHEDNRFLYFHVVAGSLLGVLIIFRVIWGVTGTQYARFHEFSFGFKAVLSYLKGLLNGSAMRHLGHNPAGGWAIFALFILGLSIVITGIVTLSAEEGHGILVGVIPYWMGEYSKEFHEIFTSVMLALVLIHISGVLFESIFHKENLVWSMLTGKKQVLDDEHSLHIKQHPLVAFLLLGGIVFAALFYLKGYLLESVDNLYQPFQSPALINNEVWQGECSDCHMAYHPSLLPKRSWQRLFKNQHDHFGDDLDLDKEALQALETFFYNNSAEQMASEPARKILNSTPIAQTPMRITETLYWKKKHEEIDMRYWSNEPVHSKGNCTACHLDANRSTYEDSNMRLPKVMF